METEFVFKMLVCLNNLKQLSAQDFVIQGVSGGIVNILGGGSMDYSE
jgi:hypothetical protein